MTFDETPMYYNVHTHRYGNDRMTRAIENIHQDFSQVTENRKVSMGLHPWYLGAETLASQLAILSTYAAAPGVVAIGECGLDKMTSTPWPVQEKAFIRQIQLAGQLDKPLIIHCVRAFDEVLTLLKNVKVPVIFHGINNKLTVVQKVLDQGYFLSFGKALTGNHNAVKNTFRATPMGQLFLETDDADASIAEIYKSAALLKNIDEKEVVLQLEKNFKTVFER